MITAFLEATTPPSTGRISSSHLRTAVSAIKDDGEDDEDPTTSNDRLPTWCPIHPFNPELQRNEISCFQNNEIPIYRIFNRCPHNPSSHRFWRSRPKNHRQSPDLSRITTTLMDPSHGLSRNCDSGTGYTILEPVHNMTDLYEDYPTSVVAYSLSIHTELYCGF